MQATPNTYIYCLVDGPNNRFKLGTSSQETYALSLAEFYCEQRSFQVGCADDLAANAIQVIRTAYAGMLVDRDQHDEHGIWFSLLCFDAVRMALLCLEHSAPPANLTWMAAEKEKQQIHAQIHKLLGL